jgi:hypothetical protein
MRLLLHRPATYFDHHILVDLIALTIASQKYKLLS